MTAEAAISAGDVAPAGTSSAVVTVADSDANAFWAAVATAAVAGV